MLNWFSQASPFELFALVTGLGAVLLLIRQNIWTWPLGLAYALVSVWVFYADRLYGQLLLHVFYVGMNAYGWWYWLYGGNRAADSLLPVQKLGPLQATIALAAGAFGSVVLGFGLQAVGDANFATTDAIITSFSFVAMYLQARKYLESWVFWLIIDIGSVALYLRSGLNFYAALYVIYLGLAVAGVPRMAQESQRLLIVTGPESAGKSTLAAALADWLDAPAVPEVARDYLSRKPALAQTYSAEDVLAIAIEQHNAERVACAQNAPLVVVDTDQVIIDLWWRERYGDPPEELIELQQPVAGVARHYLLCYPDLPWQPDPLREFPSVADRLRLFRLQMADLDQRIADYRVIWGRGGMRERLARAYVRSVCVQGTSTP